MSGLVFEWDPAKARSNFLKHGISFEEASSVFLNDTSILFDDPEHSISEERFLIIGFSSYANLLVVCHCIRESENTIRIISARQATSVEAKDYADIVGAW